MARKLYDKRAKDFSYLAMNGKLKQENKMIQLVENNKNKEEA